jgi:delta-1-pyrroline-5-carboxylate synthetase
MQFDCAHSLSSSPAHGGEAGNLLGPKTYNSAAAAAGQLGLMSLYATMLDQHDITTSQLLVTSFDFAYPERCQTIRNVMEQLLHLGIVPLLNENDAVSGNQG